MTSRDLPIVVEGFDWDGGNSTKCERHGMARHEIEGIFQRTVLILPDKPNVSGERRSERSGRPETAATRLWLSLFAKGTTNDLSARSALAICTRRK